MLAKTCLLVGRRLVAILWPSWLKGTRICLAFFYTLFCVGIGQILSCSLFFFQSYLKLARCVYLCWPRCHQCSPWQLVTEIQVPPGRKNVPYFQPANHHPLKVIIHFCHTVLFLPETVSIVMNNQGSRTAPGIYIHSPIYCSRFLSF
jgi:hypothetical protein